MAITNKAKALRDEREYVERVEANKNRPEAEVTVALIDAIHTLCYQLKDRDLTDASVREAINDLVGNSLGWAAINHAYVQQLANDGFKIKL